MTRLPIDNILGANHRIVVLDTFVVRYLCDVKPTPVWHSDFVKAKASGISFLVSGYSVIELQRQFEDGEVVGSDLIGGVALADQFIDPRMPVCPIQKDLSFMAGILPTHQETPEQITKFYADLWRRLGTASLYSGKQLTTAQALENIRATHRNCIKKIKSVPNAADVDRKTLKAAVRMILEKELQLSPQTIKVRFEPLLSLYCHFLEASLVKKEPYNEESDRRQNDGIDLLLFSSLYLNTYLITEKRWANVAKAKGDGQWDHRILTIEGFVDKFNKSQLSWA